ncbi:DNA polymerase III subunit psi [Avibacterium paragallinarum]|uniref:DNA polymerase III subunit psi n=1 Tax=Avibacterium paragallinarum TaxID=728 RepID=UPI0039873F77
MNRYQLLLQSMGIVQWKLVRPDSLKGSVNIPVNENIRLIIISETELLFSPLLRDILTSLDITQEQYLVINFDLIPHFKINHPVYYWFLNDDPKKIHQAQNYCRTFLDKWVSPRWERFMEDPVAKRNLWTQIQRKGL